MPKNFSCIFIKGANQCVFSHIPTKVVHQAWMTATKSYSNEILEIGRLVYANQMQTKPFIDGGFSQCNIYNSRKCYLSLPKCI